METVRVLLRLAIDSVSQDTSKGPRPPMLPQVVSARISGAKAIDLCAAWTSEHWVEVTIQEVEAPTYEEARQRMRKLLMETTYLQWVYNLLEQKV